MTSSMSVLRVSGSADFILTRTDCPMVNSSPDSLDFAFSLLAGTSYDSPMLSKVTKPSTLLSFNCTNIPFSMIPDMTPSNSVQQNGIYTVFGNI